MSAAESSSTAHQSHLFPATLWSAISQARLEDTPAALDGLGRLARAYWRPLYIYLRQRGRDHDTASDEVQGFFADLLSREFLSYAQPELGRFRSFLLASLQRWLGKQAEHAGRQKRGGGWERVNLDLADAAGSFSGLVLEDDPGRAFDRQWALEVVDRAVIRLQQAYAERGRAATFAALRNALPGGATLPTYEVLAGETGMSEPALRKAVHDLRNRFAAAVRQEIACTVSAPEQVDDEVRYLAALLRG